MIRTALLATALLSAPLVAQPRTIEVSNGWSRATAPRAPVGAGYLTIRNRSRLADRLVSVTSPRATRVEIHTMSTTGGVMRMRPLPGGVAIPPGGTVTLASGGSHLMLIGLTKPLVVGERVPVTLRFARGGKVTTLLHVSPVGATRGGNH
jgi:periplasmic copper chaperone A